MLELLIRATRRLAPRWLRRSRWFRALRAHLAYRVMRFRVQRGLRLVPEEAFGASVQYFARDLLQREETLGDYLEFGVFNGTSLARAHAVITALGQEQARFIGFDSFEGLPADAATEPGSPWVPGALRSDIEFTRQFLTARGVDWSRTFLVKGWFSDTLTEETRERLQIRRVSLAMVDCDLYSSALAALHFLRPVLATEAILFFDDWRSVDTAEGLAGEARALAEFAEEAQEFEFSPVGSYSRASQVVRVRRRGDPG